MVNNKGEDREKFKKKVEEKVVDSFIVFDSDKKKS